MARKSRAREVRVYLGTRKGGFVLRSDEKRKNWRVEGPFFPGVETNHLMRDPRTGKLWAVVNSWWFGSDVQFSTDNGKRWTKAAAGISFPPDRKLSVARIWRVEADRESRPETLWCGVDPGALFRTDDAGKNWYELTGLAQHPTREKWTPGAAGMMVHAISPDPGRLDRIYVGISAAGCFRSDDDGKTWTPCNKGVRADFLPNKLPDVGQCLHRMVMSPKNPDWLFQQNHCGVYRSRNDAEKWTDVSKGLPSRFGFAMAAHPHEAETIYVTPHISAEQRYVCGGKLGVYRSRNGGSSWQELKKGLPTRNCYVVVLRHGMATDGCDAAGVYVGTAGGTLFASRNEGNSWEVAADHLPPILSVETAVV